MVSAQRTQSETTDELEIGFRPTGSEAQSISELETGPRTFAILIGIDNYQAPHVPRLNHAVNDAVQLYRLLRLVGGVPESQICLLCDNEATREAIMSELRSLVTNQHIRRGDTVIIYFSGLVNLVPAPVNWGVGFAESLVPVNHGLAEGDSECHGIPDRTIAAVLYSLLQAHQINIVRLSTYRCIVNVLCFARRTSFSTVAAF